MERLSEKELEQLRKLGQLRKFVKTMLAQRIWLLVMIFAGSLIAAVSLLYYRVVTSPERFFSQVTLHFYPKETKLIKACDDRYILQLLNRQAVVNKFHSEDDDPKNGVISVFHDRKKQPNSFTIIFYAPTEAEAIAGVNSFADICIREYVEERTNELQKWKDVFAEKKQDAFNQIQEINDQEEKMLIHLDVISPEEDYERLRMGLGGQQEAKTRLNFSIRSISVRKYAISSLSSITVKNSR